MLATKPVKMVMLIIEEGIREDVEKIMKKQGIDHWTVWARIEGRGETGPKHGDPIWPGLNEVFMIAMEEEKLEHLVVKLHALRDSLPITPGMRVIIMDAQMI